MFRRTWSQLPLVGKRPPIIAAVCVLGLLAAGLVAYKMIFRSAPGDALSAAPGAARRGHLIAALGRIEPGSEIINLGPGLANDRVETLFVARGDVVKKDQVLGYLGGYAEQLAQGEVYRAQLNEAQRRLQTETDLDEVRIAAAEVHRRQVLELTPHRIAAQEATIAGLEAKLANDKDIFESQQQLLSRGTSTRRQNEDQRSIVLQDEANLTSARARLAELKQQFEIDQRDSVVQIELARATLARMQAEFPVASLQRQIILSEARAKRLTLFAPADGRILNIRVKPGEEIGSSPILTLGDTAQMRAVAEVYETDISRVRLDQLATVSSRSLAKPISGKVARIGNLIFKNDVLNVDPAARADARVVEVWIDLDDSSAVERLTNLTVDVLITTSEPKAALADSFKEGPK
jgi:HlyD family secretion protein